MIQRIGIWAAVLLLALPASAQEVSGYVDFGDLAGLGVDPEVEISLGGALLGFLSAATAEEDKELAQTLGRLSSIKLSVFDLPSTSVDDARKRVASIVDRLEADDWEPAVSVRATESTVHFYMKMDGDRVAGMTVMLVSNDGEAIFMNIVGQIDPTQLGRVAARFGVAEELGLGDAID